MQAPRNKKEANMGYAELLRRLQALPQDKQAEVFDFVEFLARRSRSVEDVPQTPTDWTDAEFTALAAQAWREDDPVVYTPADLRERWQ
jgi:hypothetical protein